MKRSTLTLSILTALLVSACGGSSNDEQTKDPTPPKVTPTQPSTPSTGRTPTTGKTEPKKEEASSSSSSDPTPPISSGSAPSGGKPIVIAGEPKKEIKPDPTSDEDENTEEDKPEDKPSDALSDIAKKLQESQTAFETAQTEAALQKTRFEQADLKAKGLRAKIDGLLPDGKKLTNRPAVAALTEEVDAKKAKEINDLYDQYVAAEKAAADAAATAEELQATADAAGVTHEENKIASEIEEFKKEWADKPQVLSVTEYVEARTAEMEAKGQQKLAEKKNENLTNQRNVLGNANKKGKGARIQELNGKLEALKKLSSKDPEVKAKIDAAIKRTEEELADANKRWEELNKEVQHAKTDEELAKGKAGAIKAADIKNKADTAKNFGVAGGKDFAADKIFLGVQKAVLDNKKWTITFDGMNEGVEVNPEAVNTPIGSDSAYGSFGATTGAESKPVAFKVPTSEKSIYGYFDDKFYSAGTVTTPEKMDQVDTTKVGEFSGTSFLVDTAGNKLVSEVKGKVRLGDKKEFEGDFQNFQTLAGTPVAIKEGRLKNYVHFKADIDKNTFKPATDTEAEVYGYFYGDKAQEAGGLVKLKDVFHGSFGGAISRE